MRDDTDYLCYVIESIQLIKEYLNWSGDRPDQSSFFADSLTQDAVLRRMETLSDAASHLSAPLKSRHPDIPWRRISDFRNALAHAYIDLHLDEIWAVIERDLNALDVVARLELQRLES